MRTIGDFSMLSAAADRFPGVRKRPRAAGPPNLVTLG
jgi:hypothetical protein